MDFYLEEGTSLFGDIFKVLNRYTERDASEHYDIQLVEDCKGLIGRLRLKNLDTGRPSFSQQTTTKTA